MNWVIPQDKANHIAYGALVGAVSSAVALTEYSVGAAGLAAVVSSAVAGVTKEWLFDSFCAGAHTVDVWDCAATVGGGALVAAPLILAGVLTS